jgi:tRNA(fMet)-specific endonuclease VapC
LGALLNRERDLYKQIPVYERLRELIYFFSAWEILTLDEPAVQHLLQLRRQRIRIGTNDLKIASIALVHHALLLSANLRDFRRIPGLPVENWLE